MKSLGQISFKLLIVSASILNSVATADVIPSGQTFNCTPTHVWDGDGPIWCEEGTKIRLAGIAAREINDECLVGHPCPRESGKNSRAGLVSILGEPVGTGAHGHILVRGPTLRCKSAGSAKGSRTAAWCITEAGLDVNCTMVKKRWAARWAAYWGAHSCD